MEPVKTGNDDTRPLNRRPRSRGVPAPDRKPPHSLLLRLRLIWLTMYPLPRLLVAAVFFLALTYGIVYVLLLVLPTHNRLAIYDLGWPVAIGAGIMAFAPGEPNDQVSVHPPHTMSESEFDELEDRVELMAHSRSAYSPDAHRHTRASTSEATTDQPDFMKLVRETIDDLPPESAHALEHVAVVVSDQGSIQRVKGRRQPLYGRYIGYTGGGPFSIVPPAGDRQPDRIVIFRDTLTHDFGDDEARLRQEVARTLRHELAHHLEFDEPIVRALGLK